MAVTVSLKGHPKFGIPPGSTVRVFSLPTDTLVFESKDAADIVVLPLDMGAYSYVVIKHLRGGRMFKYVDKCFFVGINKRTFSALKFWQAERAKVRMTSGGISKWMCGYGSCRFTTPSKIKMMLHEGKHRGVDILKELELVQDGEMPPVEDHSVIDPNETEEGRMNRTHRARQAMPGLNHDYDDKFIDAALPDQTFGGPDPSIPTPPPPPEVPNVPEEEIV